MGLLWSGQDGESWTSYKLKTRMPEAWKKGLTQGVGLVILSGIPSPILIDEAHREGEIFTLLLVV